MSFNVNSENQWWGYLHTSGSIQVKRYFDVRDIQEAKDSDFCEKVFEPFEAHTREDAINHIKKLL